MNINQKEFSLRFSSQDRYYSWSRKLQSLWKQYLKAVRKGDTDTEKKLKARIDAFKSGR